MFGDAGDAKVAGFDKLGRIGRVNIRLLFRFALGDGRLGVLVFSGKLGWLPLNEEADTELG